MAHDTDIDARLAAALDRSIELMERVERTLALPRPEAAGWTDPETGVRYPDAAPLPTSAPMVHRVNHTAMVRKEQPTPSTSSTVTKRQLDKRTASLETAMGMALGHFRQKFDQQIADEAQRITDLEARLAKLEGGGA